MDPLRGAVIVLRAPSVGCSAAAAVGPAGKAAITSNAASTIRIFMPSGFAAGIAASCPFLLFLAPLAQKTEIDWSLHLFETSRWPYDRAGTVGARLFLEVRHQTPDLDVFIYRYWLSSRWIGEACAETMTR